MAEHPEFPQASPEMKYVIDQVAKIEDAQACATGYYKSLSKVLTRLDKTDQELNQLKQISTELKDVIDTNVISKTIDGGLLKINSGMEARLELLKTNIEERITKTMKCLSLEQSVAIDDIHTSNTQLIEKADAILTRLDATATKMHNHIFPPWWKVWGVRIIILCLGIGIGKLVIP